VVDNPRIKRELSELRQKLQSDPSSLRDMMQWEPVMENGQIQGVKISPGKARQLFYELKLRRNDVVTNINGVPLNDPSQLLMLQQNLATASEVSLTILRDGQTQDITIKLDDNER
jgi:general secretion pathway protein C